MDEKSLLAKIITHALIITRTYSWIDYKNSAKGDAATIPDFDETEKLGYTEQLQDKKNIERRGLLLPCDWKTQRILLCTDRPAIIIDDRPQWSTNRKRTKIRKILLPTTLLIDH